VDILAIAKLALEAIGICAVVAKMTPWTWDDKAIGWITKVIRFLGFQKSK